MGKQNVLMRVLNYPNSQWNRIDLGDDLNVGNYMYYYMHTNPTRYSHLVNGVVGSSSTFLLQDIV